MNRLINKKAVKQLAKEHNKRVGKMFIECLERHIEHQIIKACNTWNGKKKTLDEVVAGFIGLK